MGLHSLREDNPAILVREARGVAMKTVLVNLAAAMAIGLVGAASARAQTAGAQTAGAQTAGAPAADATAGQGRVAPPAPVDGTGTAPVPHRVHRHHHARHRPVHLQAPASTEPSEAQRDAAAQKAASNAAAGTSPAPVPNEDAGPPRAGQSASAQVTPGTLGIHYPPLGDGYLPGSSSTDMDNQTTPAVPGVNYHAPIQNPAPQPLPTPQAGPPAGNGR